MSHKIKQPDRDILRLANRLGWSYGWTLCWCIIAMGAILIALFLFFTCWLTPVSTNPVHAL